MGALNIQVVYQEGQTKETKYWLYIWYNIFGIIWDVFFSFLQLDSSYYKNNGWIWALEYVRWF